MNILYIANKSLYWSNNNLFHNKFITNIMSKNMFYLINSCLHFNHNYNIKNKNIKTKINKISYNNILKINHNNKDPRIKLGDFLNILNNKFKKYYILNKNITIDETIISFHGKNSMKFYIPNKPKRWGFKLHLLSESETGYTSKILLDPGINKNFILKNNEEQYLLKTENIILQLLDNEYRNKGYHLYLDSWYSTVSLINKLNEIGIFVTSIIKENIKDIPKVNKITNKIILYKNLSLNINLLLYKENKKIIKCITNYKYNNIIDKNIKPEPIINYEKNMHGVDIMNLKTSLYNKNSKSYKWYKYIFYHMIEISLENSRIIYNKIKNKKINIFNFRLEVIKQLVENYSKRRRKVNLYTNKNKEKKNLISHLPIKKENNGKCKSCKNKIHIYCEKCEIYLCLKCYKNYHINIIKKE